MLDQREVSRCFLEADYTMLDPVIAADTIHEVVILRDLRKQLDCLVDEIMEELVLQLKTSWGADPQAWREISIWDTMTDVLYRTTNKVLVGYPLCTFPRSTNTEL
jgi:hypothetical protein